MKRLSQLYQGLSVETLHGDGDTAVSGITDDSRRVAPGFLFVARRGTADNGAKYIDDALARGAAAVVACSNTTLAELAERYYDHPSRKLELIGVTGTNGKTTVVWMIRHLLNATGHKCGLLSTIEIDDGQARQVASLTTPGACEISAALAAMVAHGCTHAAMECSSHALDQGRCDALVFGQAVFTNLTGDHLDYHKTMDAYRSAKSRLFSLLHRRHGLAIVNQDDPSHQAMLVHDSRRTTFYRIGVHPDQPNVVVDGKREYYVSAQVAASTAAGMRLCFEMYVDSFEVDSPFIGWHNAQNLLAALAVVKMQPEKAEAALAVADMPPVPGRLERVTEADAPFTVLVDYAHTDDALRNVCEALRPLVPDGAKLRVLFGCGGDRDATKRPRMAQIACELADHAVVTSDNPRTEDAQAIIDDVMVGVPDSHADRVERLTDRREAIAAIITAAQPGDVVLLAGKGHEDYQIIGTQKQPFDDRVVARQVLDAIET